MIMTRLYYPIALRIGNYMYDDRGSLFRRKAGGQTWVVGYSTAYNALGLIGSEINGIFVLNETKRDVVLDEYMKTDTGWFGPKQEHLSELDRLQALPAKDFLAWLRNHPRTREQYRR